LKVIAFDSAGNKTESEKVRFYVIHKPKKEGKQGDIGWREDRTTAGVVGGSTERPASGTRVPGAPSRFVPQLPRGARRAFG
jgi:hypothetical protein